MTVLYTMTRLGTAKNVTDTVERLLKRKPITLRQYVKDYQHFFRNDNGTTVRREIVENRSKNKTL